MIRLRPPYLYRVFDAISQFVNVVLLNGDANESISGRAHRQGWKTAEALIDTLFFLEPGHCYWAHMNDLARARELVK